MATNPFFSGKNKHFLQILSLSVITLGLAAGVILTQNPQIFTPKAEGNCVCIKNTDSGISKPGLCQADGSCTCPSGFSILSNSCANLGGRSCPPNWVYCGGCVSRCIKFDNNGPQNCQDLVNASCNNPKGYGTGNCASNSDCKNTDAPMCCSGVCQESCGTAPKVNCKNIAISGGSTTLTKGITYTITASYGTLGRNGTERMHVESGTSGCNEISGVISPDSYPNGKKATFTWTPNTAGTFTIYCEESASAYGMCFGEGDCKPPTGRSTTCKGPTAKVTVTVK